jgi:nucleoside-diphosphate-sugar epimerase
MRERVLITGASGFLGFHIIEAAQKMGLEVYAAVRKSSDVKHLASFNIQYTYPDFSSISGLKKELEEKQYHYIIHAAAVTKAGSEDEYNKVNADYTYHLGKAAEMAAINLKKFVFVSSLAAIGPLQQLNGMITENTKPQPVTYYGKSKLLAEEKLLTLNLPLTIIRPTAIYGPREKDILILFKTIAKGWEPYIGKLPQQLSFVYVKDVADIIVNALFSKHRHTAYNISDGGMYNRYEMADYAKGLLDKKTTRVYLPGRMARMLAFTLEKTYALVHKVPAFNRDKLYELTAMNWNCSIEKAKMELGFAPRYNLVFGLMETLEWYKKNKWI